MTPTKGDKIEQYIYSGRKFGSRKKGNRESIIPSLDFGGNVVTEKKTVRISKSKADVGMEME